MRASCALAIALFCVSVFAGPVSAKDEPRPTPAVAGGVISESSTSIGLTKMPETFTLYGGPGSGEGDFETSFGAPDFDGWTPEDVTEDLDYWQLSTFNAGNLNDHGLENVAYWCGQTAEQQPGWVSPPGYGNSWNQILEWSSGPLANTSVGQTVTLEFAFNHETEWGYDFLHVEYLLGNTWQTVFSIDGTNRAGTFPDYFFPVPGVQYPADVDNQPIVYAGGDYGGPSQDEIQLRLRVTSDGAWSNEDGFFPTVAGACQVDDVRVTYSDGSKAPVVNFSDFDNTNHWSPNVGPYAGDFAQVFGGFEDIDECRENPTGVVLFVDDGSCPRNFHNNFGEPPCESTGGEPPVYAPAYGVPGGWVVNWHGGVSYGIDAVYNRVLSPPIAWDLPGPADDDPAIRGAKLRFDVWRHLDLNDGIFYTWLVRSSDDGGTTWGRWNRGGFVWYGSNPAWITHEEDMTMRIEGPFTHLQVALEVRDMAGVFAFPGMGARPSPAYDNVEVLKYRLDGPVMSVAHADMYQDAFPQSGQASFHTQADRAIADVRLDIARDLGGLVAIVPGDSLVVDVVTAIPGTDVDEVKLFWVMDKNPKFDDVRVMPPSTTVTAGGALNGWDQWSGEIASRHPTDSWGPILDEFFFDFPDEDFFHPGDVLRYYVSASDDQGRVATLPADVSGFASGRTVYGGRYAPPFTIRALPSVIDDGQGGWTQPQVLWVDDFGHRGGGNDRNSAFDENGWVEGVHYDVYTVMAPTSTQSNGIGSVGAYGATASQLAGYEVLLYSSGDLELTLDEDKSNDVGVLRNWFEQDADRAIAHFGDNVASSLALKPLGGPYLTTVMGVGVFGSDVAPTLGGVSSPRVRPLEPAYQVEYGAYGSCLYVNESPDPAQLPGFDLTSRQFDDIGPLTGAVYGHRFLNMVGQPYVGPGGAGSVLWDRLDGNGNRKISATFPYGFLYVWEEPDPSATPFSVRGQLLREVLVEAFSHPLPDTGSPTAVGDQASFRGLRELRGAPNPFNPRVRISFEIGRRSMVEAQVFNVRGERVLTLLNEERPAGRVEFTWDGRDARGEEIASGVYFVRVRGDGQSKVQKVALVR